ncbi:MAG: AAA family ATPase [Acidobacteria bacterium RIFCSPLOWO2_12_FULL_67_14]|nr:MAG: AAA family ATPase [Acidobacteria bacterium RIFCSPLOWO2_02_FULL_67_21]OFW34716.1 MAG: AAA family ATPase [Acidobacteria bacterium RIFCSPLOWO2_12_FULL_67_14]
MSTAANPAFERQQAGTLVARLSEPRRFLQIVAGARQAGKTTLVGQVLSRLDIPSVFVSADEPTVGDTAWLAAQWERGRLAATDAGKAGAVLVLDEVQKIPRWSETVKRLWDEDSRARRPLKVVLLGSAPLLMQQGLTESLAGRFEVVHLPHWSFAEMRAAFGFSLEEYLYFGGYPGAAPLIKDPQRWRRYLLDALIETTISRDVLLMTRVDKPALLRRLFELGCRYSGQVLSYTKMLGQLQDVGNATTLAHYLELLGGAGMLTGLQKYAGKAVRQRGSSPKLQVMNTALMTAQSGLSPNEARADREFRGRLVESAVGAHLANAAAGGTCDLFYWRERNREVDFVVRAGRTVIAIEVKSGRAPGAFPGLGAFAEAFKPKRTLLVGGDGISLEEFLTKPVEHWLQT